jgi:DNA-binding MarR family transcriptional regulator
MREADDAPVPGPPPSALTTYTGYLLRRALLRTKACGVTPPGRRPTDLPVLAAVTTGRLSQRRLGEILDVNRSVVVRLVDGLEAHGLLTRERDLADRRNHRLQVTGAGKAAIAELTSHAAAVEPELTAALTRSERTHFVHLLARVVPDLVPLVPAELTRLSGFLIPRGYLRVRTIAAGPGAELGVAPQQSGLLAALAHNEPCSQQRLADALGVTGPAIVAGVTELQDRGLIARERNELDRREHLLRLTPRGREMLAASAAVARQVQQRLAEQTGAAELAELNAMLTRITS